MPTIAELEDRIFQLERAIAPQVGVQQDRRNGEQPVVILRGGSVVRYWGTTGEIADSASGQAWLTDNGLPGGRSIFTRAPLVMVLHDVEAESGGALRADAPFTPDHAWDGQVVGDDLYDWDLIRDKGAKVWYVEVDNATGAAADFYVVAQGV